MRIVQVFIALIVHIFSLESTKKQLLPCEPSKIFREALLNSCSVRLDPHVLAWLIRRFWVFADLCGSRSEAYTEEEIGVQGAATELRNDTDEQ